MIGATALSWRGGSFGASVVRCASRVLGRRSVQRLLAVGGLAAAGWLLSGGGTAFADQVRPDDGARHTTGAPVHPAPVNDRSARATASQPSAELDVLAGRARRTGSHSAHHAHVLPRAMAVPGQPEAAPADGSSGEPADGAGFGPGGESRLGEPPAIVPELSSAPAPNRPGVPSLTPVTGVPGNTIAAAGARTTAGDEASAPAAGVKASAPVTTGEEAAGPTPPSAMAHHGASARPGGDPPAAQPQGAQPGDRQPASSGSSGAARIGAAGETVPLGTARTGPLPYGPSLLSRATPAPRGTVPAMRTAADEPSFSPD